MKRVCGALAAIVVFAGAGAAIGQPLDLPGLFDDGKAKPPGPPPITQNPMAIEPGVYMCVGPGAKGPSAEPTPFAVNIQDEKNYLLYTGFGQDKEPGGYVLEEGLLIWNSGPMKAQPPGKYEGDARVQPNQMRIQAQPAGSPLLNCYMYDGPA